jgi:predicted DNA-binding transcriptional regulator YafY
VDRTERFYRIEQLLHERQAVPMESFLEELGVSAATFKRDLEYLRDRFRAPIVWDRTVRGYRFERAGDSSSDAHHALPGLWFSASEIYALLTMRHLLAQLQPGLLEPHIQPLLARLNSLLGRGEHAPETVERRVRILHAAQRGVDSRLFPEIAQALLQRRRLRIRHCNRGSGETLRREVSPQRLVHYRDNWYLDAWCHLREGLRSFAVDVIEAVTVLDQEAREVDDAELEQELASGYGIFSGKEVQWALLRFSPERARWVRAEQWHPEQRGHLDEDGYFWLRLPFNDDRELLMDILRHGDQVEVLEPLALRERIAEGIGGMLARYQK